MKTFLLENGEIVFSGKNIVMVSDVECLRQRLYNRIRLFRGEWFLAPSFGIAWISLLSEKSNAVMIQSEIRRAILSDNEVNSIESLSVEEDAASRSLRIRFSAITELGKIEGATQL